MKTQPRLFVLPYRFPRITQVSSPCRCPIYVSFTESTDQERFKVLCLSAASFDLILEILEREENTLRNAQELAVENLFIFFSARPET